LVNFTLGKLIRAITFPLDNKAQKWHNSCPAQKKHTHTLTE